MYQRPHPASNAVALAYSANNMYGIIASSAAQCKSIMFCVDQHMILTHIARMQVMIDSTARAARELTRTRVPSTTCKVRRLDVRPATHSRDQESIFGLCNRGYGFTSLITYTVESHCIIRRIQPRLSSNDEITALKFTATPRYKQSHQPPSPTSPRLPKLTDASGTCRPAHRLRSDATSQCCRHARARWNDSPSADSRFYVRDYRQCWSEACSCFSSDAP